MALRFHAQREGAEHRRLKRLLYEALQADSEVSDLHSEKVVLGEVLKGEWKKPDLRCIWRGKSIVFEIQLSYTFISEVVKRDTFYAAEGSFIIWVFSKPNLERAVVIDEMYYNRRNLFVFDQSAEKASEKEQKLLLRCFHTVPSMHPEGSGILDIRVDELVSLDNLTYPTENYRPYYFDYKLARSNLTHDEAERRCEQRTPIAPSPQLAPTALPRLIKDPLRVESEQTPYMRFASALLNFSDSGARQVASQLVEKAIADMPTPEERESASRALIEPWYTALVRLIGVAHGRPLLTKYQSVYQVLDAVLQPSAIGSQRFAHLYCECWAAYRPAMKQTQAGRMEEARRRVTRAIVEGDPSFRVDADFASLIERVLPRIHLHAAAYTPINQQPLPSYLWSLGNPNRELVKKIGERYLQTHPETDWRNVYRNALRLRDRSVSEAIELLQQEFNARPGDISNFLISCGLSYTRRK